MYTVPLAWCTGFGGVTDIGRSLVVIFDNIETDSLT